MEKEELIKSVCYELGCYASELEYPDPYNYSSNEAYKDALERGKKIRKYIEELKKI